MKIKELHLQNFRCFESLNINFHPSLTVLVGENGSGKSSILDAISIAFGRVLTRLQNKGISFKLTDLRITTNDKLAPAVYYWIEVADISGDKIRWSARKNRDLSKSTQEEIFSSIPDMDRFNIGFKEIDQFAAQLIDRHNHDENYTVPVISYYGTNRAMIDEKIEDSNRKYNRFSSLGSALNPHARFQLALEWFCDREDVERRTQLEQKDFNYTDPVLNTVRKAIESMLLGFRCPRTERRPQSVQKDMQVYRYMKPVFLIDREYDGTTRTHQIDQLSDGYRVMLGVVIDLARRMVQANPPSSMDGEIFSDPLQFPAIVLIDEVDLHLHPVWQQHVLADFQRTFPNSQFIVTTHSPQILTTVPSECIRILKDEKIFAAPFGTEGADPSRMLTQVLGLEYSRPPQNKATLELKEYMKLVYNDQWSGERALELRQILDERYQDNEPDLLEADLYIENRKWELGE